MEKGTEINRNKLNRIVITGPECTGKTTLAMQLASHYHTIFIPEYARTYVEDLCRPYEYNDIVRIAEMQKKQHDELKSSGKNLVFLDTYLIITKLWFNIVYGKCPEWIDNELSAHTIDLYLLCNTDIPWVADSVRENGGEMREKLFAMYKNELISSNQNYRIISGQGQQRLQNAREAVDEFMHNNNLNK
jgi:NadR type nicotinamide-nucleotide adenylyltransferase